VIHRDLKPSNIMVSTDPSIGTVKITDFGVARMAAAEVEEAMGAGGDPTLGSPTVVGALPYMAPEVIKNVKSDIKLSADVWSAGAILYQLLTGQRPFGEGLAAVERILKADMAPKPDLLNHPQFKHLVDGLWSIVTKCLVLKPDERPTAAQLVELCGQLSYSGEGRQLGVISKYKEGTGNWGFISYGEGDSAGQTFFHVSSYWGGQPEVGKRVSFAMFPGYPASRAFPVLPLRQE
jgi:serine/threonine protein kinase